MSIPDAVSQKHVHGIDFQGKARQGKALMMNPWIVFIRVYRIQALILCHP